MRRQLINAQISNYKTSKMYLRQCLALAENVFSFTNLPTYIDTAFLNKTLLSKGSIAFFEDEVMGVVALPYVSLGKLDIYGRPQKIQVSAQNGYTRVLNQDEFVIMYDNNGRYPLYLDIVQYSERLALNTRTIDINIAQQKTPRFWKTPAEKEETIRDLINSVDGYENEVIAYDGLDLEETTLVLNPSPYVSDKIDEQKQSIWNEFLRLIGVANMSYQKKERNIKDEVFAQHGGTIASRFNRFEPRKKAVEEINEKFGLNIQVEFYDGLPTTIVDTKEYIDFEETEVEDNDISE